MKSKVLFQLLQANPNLHVKVAETKKHNDNAPTMAVIDGEKCLLDNSEEEVILLWIEPNPETILSLPIAEESKMKEGSGIKVTAMGDELAETVKWVLDNPRSIKVFPELLAALKKYNGNL